MDNVCAAIDAMKSRYYCKGIINGPMTVTLPAIGDAAAAASGEHVIKFPLGSLEAEASLKPLLSRSNESAFGHGHETKVDATVRTARDLLPDAYETSFAPSEAMLEEIRTSLVPDAAQVRAVPHKLNIMTTGGHFAPHQDTPRGAATCFGTLVVSLPVNFSGGHLQLTHAGVTHSHSGIPKTPYSYQRHGFPPSNVVPEAKMKWVAFFGDVSHQVLRVSSGYRLTMTYVLHRDQPPNPNADMLLARADGLRKALKGLLADESFMPEGGHVGVYCRHQYEESALAQTVKAFGKGGKWSHAPKLKLKDEDAVVGACLSAAGLNPMILRMVGHTYANDDSGPRAISKIPTKKDAKDLGFVGRVDGGWRASCCTPDDFNDFGSSVEDELGGEVEHWLGSHGPAHKAWCEKQYGDYFGNEASSSEFYSFAAIAVHVPEAGERHELALGAPLTAAHVRVVEKSATKPAPKKKAVAAKLPMASPMAVAAPADDAPAAPADAQAAPTYSSEPAVGVNVRRKFPGYGFFNGTIASAAETGGWAVLWEDDETTTIADAEARKCAEQALALAPAQAPIAPSAAKAATATPASKRKAKAPARNVAKVSYVEHSDGDSDYEEWAPVPAKKKAKSSSSSSSAAAKSSSSSAAAAAAAPAAAAAVSASAPADLYAGSASSATNKAALLNCTRTIHITGGKGSVMKAQKLGGVCDVTILAGQGLRELKAAIRKRFGKYDYHTAGALKLPSGKDAKGTDLVNDVTLTCTYTFTAGNGGNFGGGRGGGRRYGGFGFGGGGGGWMMLGDW